MKLDLKALLAKITASEPEEKVLSNSARLIRIGRCRILVLDRYTLQEAIVIPSADRPSEQIEAIMWAWNSNETYYKSGNVAVSTGGAISAWATYNYNSATNQSALGSTEKIICTLTWFVGGVVRKLLKALKPLTLGRGWAV